MFAYNPTANDTSGAILGQGMMGAASTRADAQVKMVDDIGGALMSIAGAYKGHSDMKSSIKSGEKMLDVLGPAIGMTTDKLKTLGYNEMDDRSKAMFFDGIFGGGNYATAAQARNFGLGFDQKGQQPFVNADLRNRADIAAGNQTFTGGGGRGAPRGMTPVEPDLPVPDDVLPAVRPPVAQPGTIPGGDQSKAAMNAWLRSRGLPEVP